MMRFKIDVFLKKVIDNPISFCAEFAIKMFIIGKLLGQSLLLPS